MENYYKINGDVNNIKMIDRQVVTEMSLKEIQFSKVSGSYKSRKISINTE